MKSPVLIPEALAAGPEGKAPERESRRWLGLLLLVTLLAIGLRAMAIDRQSFWYDEMGTVRFMNPSFSDILLGRIHDNGSPPLYYLLSKAWSMMFGSSERALRSLALVFGVLAVPLVGVLGRRLVGREAALLASLLLAISPVAVALSNEARAYTLLQLLAVASTLLFVRWTESEGWPALLLYSFSIFLTCYTHVFGFPVPIAHGLCLLLTQRRLFARWTLAMALAALLWSSWLPFFLEQSSNLEPLTIPWLTQFLATPVYLAVGRTLAWKDSSMVMMGFAQVVAVVGFALPWLKGSWLLRGRRFEVSLLTLWFTFPIVLAFMASFARAPFYQSRYAFVGLPAYLLLIAAGLVALRRSIRHALLGLILAGTLFSLFRYVSLPFKDDWRSVATSIVSRGRPDEPILFDPDHESTSFAYYAARLAPEPRDLIAIKEAPRPGVGLRGRVLEYGLWGAVYGPTVQIARTLHAPRFHLVLCRPVNRPEDYARFFAAMGYQPSPVQHFHRIDVVTFTRDGDGGSPGQAPETLPPVVAPN